ncbi:MAG: hypothetical protein IAI48_00465 [Candidatus Eremiobacteraeota bacterium]|nr:hypothetical protein [Candidatus Eremiobacteraeota bacterium]
MKRWLLLAALTSCAAPAAAQTYSSQQNETANAVASLRGQAFWAGGNATSTGVALNLRYLFTNPAGSGVNCVVAAMTTYASQGGAMAFIFESPTAGLPTTTVPSIATNLANINTAKCTVQADTSTTALSGGTATNIAFGVPANAIPYLLPMPVVVVPGTSVGINVPVPIAVGASSALILFWREPALNVI